MRFCFFLALTQKLCENNSRCTLTEQLANSPHQHGTNILLVSCGAHCLQFGGDTSLTGGHCLSLKKPPACSFFFLSHLWKMFCL